VLHQVPQPDKEGLRSTAEAIVRNQPNSNTGGQIDTNLVKIAQLYDSIMKDQDDFPFDFDFYGHRDFYSLASFLKYSTQEVRNPQIATIEGVMRNFGGMTKKQTEDFLFRKIGKYICNGNDPSTELIWGSLSPLHLIHNNITQTRQQAQSPNKYEIRNIMLITESPVMWKILFDSGIASVDTSEVIFGSRFSGDAHSTIYLYRTIERVRNAMNTGKLCILLKLEQLYDALYDVLNQRYQTVDDQKFSSITCIYTYMYTYIYVYVYCDCSHFFFFFVFVKRYCRICFGGDSIRCHISESFRFVVVVPREEAFHESKNAELHTPVAFLSRFEKYFLDPNLLEQFGLDPLWRSKFEALQKRIITGFSDHRPPKLSTIFVGFVQSYTYVSLLINETTAKKNKKKREHEEKHDPDENDTYDVEFDDNTEHKKADEIKQSADNCWQILLQNTSLQYMIGDQNKQRTGFIPYANILDVLKREGANKEDTLKLIKVTTHDFQLLGSHVVETDNVCAALTRDASPQSAYVPSSNADLQKLFASFGKKDKKMNKGQLTEIRLKELRDFVQETDFFTYVLDFFRDNTSPATHNVLVLTCDALMHETMLMHYLHVQYLVEKAYTNHLKTLGSQNTDRIKTFIMLIFVNRESTKSSKEQDNKRALQNQDNSMAYPLIFNTMWKHVFVDALLPADYMNEIQISDINISDGASLNEIRTRVKENRFFFFFWNNSFYIDIIYNDCFCMFSMELFINSYEIALNFIDVGRTNQSILYEEIHRLKNYLSLDIEDKGNLRQALNLRLRGVLDDPQNGVEPCLRQVLHQPLAERRSLRSQFMSNVVEKIKFLLVEILLVLFENRNILLYRSPTVNDIRMDDLFLQLLQEPKIVTFSQTKHEAGVVPKDDIPDGCQFPFSSHVHAYFSSFRESFFHLYERKQQENNGNLLGFLIIHIHNLVQTTQLKISFDGLPTDIVQSFLRDIVQLEGNGSFGLQRLNEDVRNLLVDHIYAFVERAAVAAFRMFGTSRVTQQVLNRGRRYGDESKNGGDAPKSNENDDDNAEIQILNDDAQRSRSNSDSDSKSEEKREFDDIPSYLRDGYDNDQDDDEDEEKDDVKVEDSQFQVTEVYAVLWSHEALLRDYVDMLSLLSKRELEVAKRIWEEELHLHDAVGKILMTTLECVERLLQETSKEELKKKVDMVISVSSALGNLLQWSNQNSKDNELKKKITEKWNVLKLTLLCIAATNYHIRNDDSSNFIVQTFGACQFDDFRALNALLEHVKRTISSQDRARSEDQNEILQWLVQTYIRTFTLKPVSDSRSIANQNQGEFAGQLALWVQGADITFSIKPTQFTKMEIVVHWKIYVYIKKKKKEAHENIRNALVNQAQTCKLDSEFGVLLVRAQEQFLHFQEAISQTTLKQQDKPNVTRYQQLSQLLAQRVNENNMLDIFLAIAECKVWVYYLSHYIGSTFDSPYSYVNEGIEIESGSNQKLVRSVYLTASDCKAIGQLFMVDKTRMGETEWRIRQGLRYYLLIELWRRKGSRASIHLTNKKFSNLFGFSMDVNEHQASNLNIPKSVPLDDTFRLLEHCGDEKMNEYYTQSRDLFTKAIGSNKIEWNWFQQRYFIHFVAGLHFFFIYLFVYKHIYNRATQNKTTGVFNQLYLNKNYKHLQMVSAFTRKIGETHLNIRQQVHRERDSQLTHFQNQKDEARLENVQVYRLAWQLIGVILSLPQSPLSILFHDPMAYQNNYLLAMPEDQSALLLQAMAGCGAWLCPNNHLYFVMNCTRTKESAKCPTCGEDIGNKADAEQHNAAKNNQRLGTVQADGKIKPDHLGATEGVAEYRPDLLAPKGYVIMEGGVDDKCRDFDDVSIRIARLFVSLVLLMHHCNQDKSECIKLCLHFFNTSFFFSHNNGNNNGKGFTKLDKDGPKTMAKLFTMVQSYIEAIGKKSGASSFESTLLLLHSITHRLYLTFATKFPQGFADLSIEGRRKFEKYLLEDCITPVMQAKDEHIRKTRAQIGLHLEYKYWGKRVEEDMNLESDEYKEFENNYIPNTFLPFRFVTLSEFRQFVIQKPENKQKYPVLWGILKTIDMTGVEEKQQSLSAAFVMKQQEKNKWGDKHKWEKAWQGFSEGWNHVASRVTADRQKQGLRVDREQNTKRETIEEKKEVEEKKVEEKKEEPHAALQIDTGMGEFERYLILASQCQTIKFECIRRNGPNDTFKAADVPLSLALYCGSSGPLATSNMIYLLLEHLVTINNNCLINCYQLNEQQENSLGNINLTHISSEKDVVGMDETQFLQEIQQHTSQQLKYGKQVGFDLNLKFLEHRIKEQFIVGRKFITFTLNEVLFELAGQHDIRQLVALINQKHQKLNENYTTNYFQRPEKEYLGLLQGKILQRAEYNFMEYKEYLEDFENENEKENKEHEYETSENKLIAYKTAINAIAQVIVSLYRQRTLPDGNTNKLGDYMETVLHLQQAEYEPFRSDDLCLKHCEAVWKYLEKIYLLAENKWHNMPTKLMKLYQEPVPSYLEKELTHFATKTPSEQMWELLMQWKLFLEIRLSQEDYEKANLIPLHQYLGISMSDTQLEKLVQTLPGELNLTNAGVSYVICAKTCQKREQNNQIEEIVETER
ncbi:hypothetical protein RFI_30897, partial [Reticulomyxa filosa]